MVYVRFGVFVACAMRDDWKRKGWVSGMMGE